MKILKYILGILALLVLLFILIGQIASEITYDYEITVDKPVAESWAVIQDESKMGDWLEGFQSIEHVSGPKDGVGAVSDVHFLEPGSGQPMTIRETITAMVPNESISMTFTSDVSHMDYTLQMAEVNGKTKISTNTTTYGKGMVYKSMFSLMRGMIKANEERNLANLKRTIEENTTDYFPEPEEAAPVETMEEATETN